ncbi:tRNA (adenosine(37)-N6)-threonylcarbamoyltransferase complex ATPase subunit type 1 TsaE [Amorphus sp. 3PC139-8]|uniref:tRNA (adenosine(37)-N6)-threonylcarbamoyltransferase complex ATPase subunit type 1 TsaE n=1 Tax=Amorphus sp. 3PC139-8 TaxID=2735676 RepID=UPI00345D1573
MTAASLTIAVADEAAMRRLAEDIATLLARGDLVTLSGPLGAGKTTFARALLRSIADDEALEVPSPTYTLLQPYTLGRLTLAHIDLYRLADPEEAIELGLEDLLSDGAVLVEWPEQGAGVLPPADLAIDIAPGEAAEARTVTFTAAPGLAGRLARSLEVRAFLDRAGYPAARRRYLQGDASSRTYERVDLKAFPGEVGTGSPSPKAVLMNAPTQPDGDPIYDGKPYSRVAHLAESVRPFVAIGEALRSRGYAAPAILAFDLDHGFLLLEDLGTTTVLERGVVVEERYAVATDLLADMHAGPMPGTVALPDGSTYELPPFDPGVFRIELSLYPDWFVPHATGAPMPEATREDFLDAWDALWPLVEDAEMGWLLRDFHSPNLMWLAERDGLARIGLIDYQDALIGPTAYDLASLLQDARVTVAADIETRLLARYIAARRAGDPAFDETGFRRAYALMAAQRTTKVLGIFARLNVRDGKPAYLSHLPRLADDLRRTLADPIFTDLRAFYDPALSAIDLSRS